MFLTKGHQCWLVLQCLSNMWYNIYIVCLSIFLSGSVAVQKQGNFKPNARKKRKKQCNIVDYLEPHRSNIAIHCWALLQNGRNRDHTDLVITLLAHAKEVSYSLAPFE